MTIKRTLVKISRIDPDVYSAIKPIVGNPKHRKDERVTNIIHAELEALVGEHVITPVERIGVYDGDIPHGEYVGKPLESLTIGEISYLATIKSK